eukprot:TRINITY_DN11500_c0_g1_i1.p1 TRINITY_DN11500_c0_g1~~TRINITY_DN11500_c0_g1_i1.p1  ORF type:complete len:245 (-),score=41.57 TRINITY_DN11500_c0_g1_i1:43-777(-)
MEGTSSQGDEPKAQLEVTLQDDNKKLSIVGQDIDSFPEDLGPKHGQTVTQLDLSHNNITKITNLEHFTKLDSLVVDNNSLTSNQSFPPIKTLRTLCVNNNNISELEPFLNVVTESFPNLTYLSLLKNPACPNYFTGKDQEDYQRYRFFVLYKLPNLKYLDSSPVTENERKEAKRVGKFVGVVARPSEEEYEKPADEDPDMKDIKGLSTELRAADRPGGASFGVSRYVYYGRQSEGNRFIRDDAL